MLVHRAEEEGAEEEEEEEEEENDDDDVMGEDLTSCSSLLDGKGSSVAMKMTAGAFPLDDADSADADGASADAESADADSASADAKADRHNCRQS